MAVQAPIPVNEPLLDGNEERYLAECIRTGWISSEGPFVQVYGLPVDMDRVLALARRCGLKIIEDAAEMHGQTCRGRPCGSFGDVSTFSFYPNKLVTTGEGGIVLTDDAASAERCRAMRN